MTNIDYCDLLVTENRIKLLEPYKGSKLHHKMQCLECNHVWSATPISKRQAFRKYGVSGCPECNKRRKEAKFRKIREDKIYRLKQRGITILSSEYDGRLRLDYSKTLKEEKILVRNENCGHEFLVTPLNLLQSNVECGVCGPIKRIKQATKWSKEKSQEWQETASEWQIYKMKVNSLTRKVYKKNKKEINPNNLKRGKAGTEGAYHLDHIVPIRFCFEHKIPPEVCADKTNLQMMGWRENVGSRDRLKDTIPHIFLQYISDDDVLKHNIAKLQRMFPTGHHFKKVCGISTTTYLPETNTAIVLIPIGKKFANQKTASAAATAFAKNNVEYYIIFEDELNSNKFQIVHKKLQHYLQHNQSTRIHGRKCTIQAIHSKNKRDFLNMNHIQGNDNAKVCYGAYYEDELVAVMTFTKPRVALGYKNRASCDNVWELSRFATSIKYRIPGIASKILNQFEKEYTPKKIISYADRRWSVGNMYRVLGFDLENISSPGYHYIINGIRKHRWNYRKDILKHTLPDYDANETEYHNMERAGYWRVWDCGMYRFVKDCSQHTKP